MESRHFVKMISLVSLSIFPFAVWAAGENPTPSPSPGSAGASPAVSPDHDSGNPLIGVDANGGEYFIAGENKYPIRKESNGREYLEFNGDHYMTWPWRNTVIVTFKGGLTQRQKEKTLQPYGNHQCLHFPGMTTYAVTLKNMTVKKALEMLKKDPSVSKAGADGPVFYFAFQ